MGGQGGVSRGWADITPGLWGRPRDQLEGGRRGVSARGSFLPVSMFSCLLEHVSDPCMHWNIWVSFSSYRGIVSAAGEFWLTPHLWGAGVQGSGGCVRAPMRAPVLGSVHAMLESIPAHTCAHASMYVCCMCESMGTWATVFLYTSNMKASAVPLPVSVTAVL